MARASYIWVVLEADPRTWPVVRVFTVKHRLVTWLGKQFERGEYGEETDLHVLTCRDGELHDATPDHEGIPTIWEFWKANQ